jgi:hypothetical protein
MTDFLFFSLDVILSTGLPKDSICYNIKPKFIELILNDKNGIPENRFVNQWIQFPLHFSSALPLRLCHYSEKKSSNPSNVSILYDNSAAFCLLAFSNMASCLSYSSFMACNSFAVPLKGRFSILPTYSPFLS